MSIVKEFQEFAVKGNVVDMAVGIIIGAEFGKIVNSMVADIIMPLVSPLLNGLDFKNLYIPLSEKAAQFATLAEAQKAGVATLNIGSFITAVINFAIIAFSIFLMIKAINKTRRLAPAPVVKP
jgi:large conductance mechanosensitive channel